MNVSSGDLSLQGSLLEADAGAEADNDSEEVKGGYCYVSWLRMVWQELHETPKAKKSKKEKKAKKEKKEKKSGKKSSKKRRRQEEED